MSLDSPDRTIPNDMNTAYQINVIGHVRTALINADRRDNPHAPLEKCRCGEGDDLCIPRRLRDSEEAGDTRPSQGDRQTQVNTWPSYRMAVERTEESLRLFDTSGCYAV